MFRDFSTFSCTCIFISSDSFSSLIFSLLLFSSLTLPTSAFSSVPIVGSLTSKLPSMNVYKYVFLVCILSIYICVCITCACICLCGHHSPHICVCDTFYNYIIIYIDYVYYSVYTCVCPTFWHYMLHFSCIYVHIVTHAAMHLPAKNCQVQTAPPNPGKWHSVLLWLQNDRHGDFDN